MMAMVMDQQQQQQPQQPQQQQQQQQAYKHYCRICKKGFGCGRALGGHMRAHGINDDIHTDPDDDPPSSEWDDRLDPPAGHKRMYALRTNPNRLKSCRVCENCGKEFLSWKSFLEHGKCSSEEDAGDDYSLASSPRSDADADADDDDPVRGCAGWSKGKRSRRAKAVTPVCPSSEEEDLANCLVMLSAARVDPVAIVETEESCASASKEEDRRQHPIAVTATTTTEKPRAPVLPPGPAVPRGMFECKACKKVFISHQALGGHRASHKKVKGCFAAKIDGLEEAPADDEVITTHDNNNSEMAAAAMAMAIVPFENPPLAITPLKKKSKVHECSICHRVFASGQALGGHKRCHWITLNAPDPGAIAKLHQLPPGHAAGGVHPQLMLGPMFESSDTLDLNLPAPIEDLAGVQPRDMGGPLQLDVPAALYLQPWIDHSNTNTNTDINTNENKATTSSNNNSVDIRERNNEPITNANVDDEADSKVKLAKLSELKDINMGGERSPWLQVGIGSSTKEGTEP